MNRQEHMILIVEDEPKISSLLEDYLQTKGEAEQTRGFSLRWTLNSLA